jgi:hypothetical protein
MPYRAKDKETSAPLTLFHKGIFMIVRFWMCVLLFASCSCFATELEEALGRAGLVESDIPAGDKRTAAANSPVVYVVANDAGQLTIKEEMRFRRSPDTKVNFNGKLLIGRNRGEWGGNLSFVDADGTSHVLIGKNVVQLIQEKDELFVFTGLAHGTIVQGELYKVTHDKEGVSAEKLTLLPGAPEAVATDRNDRGYFAFLIVTNDGLLSFRPQSSEMKMLAIDQFWRGLSPSSALLLDDQLIVGMRSGVAVISGRLSSGGSVTKIQYFSKKAR